MPELSPASWTLLVTGAAFAGFSKTAVGGAGAVAVALFALVLPARESTGTVLPLLICGDLVGVALYRRHADWRLLWRLMPWVGLGIGLGVGFLARVRDDGVLRLSLGVLILIVIAGQVMLGDRVRQILAADDNRSGRAHQLAAALAGIGVGFTTMVANSAGSIMTVYLLLSGVTMLEFLGTGAWFFLVVNLVKVPFGGALGLIRPESLRLDLVLLPAVLAGTALGALVIRRIDRRRFERVALVMAAVSATFLLLPTP